MSAEFGLQYGWYSEHQAQLVGVLIYLGENGEQVRVTQVSSTANDGPLWADARFVGMVSEFVRIDVLAALM
jgi:hypothetical protein